MAARDEGAEPRGSAPVMSTKDLLLEVYHDMKFVRPAVEQLMGAHLVERVLLLEQANIRLEAAGSERGRLASISNKMLAILVIVANAAVAIWVQLHSV